MKKFIFENLIIKKDMVIIYNLKHHSLVQTIRKLKLPLIVCRSKSGGAHIFLFTTEFIPASLMQNTLKKISKMQKS